jgi:hypothetical protein
MAGLYESNEPDSRLIPFDFLRDPVVVGGGMGMMDKTCSLQLYLKYLLFITLYRNSQNRYRRYGNVLTSIVVIYIAFISLGLPDSLLGSDGRPCILC